MSHVFISYKREDRARLKPLVDALIAAGVPVWWDVQIEGGAHWRETIKEKLDAAGCVIVAWSALSVASEGRFVQDEAARADRRGILLPVLLDAVEPPLGFGHQQAYSLIGWRGDARDRRVVEIVEGARAVMTGGARRGAAPIAPIAPGGRGWSRRGFAVAGGVSALGVAAVVAFELRHGAAATPTRSLAVLPFANMSGDVSQDFFSDGLSEELRDKLAHLPQLQVSGRTSSFKFKGSKDDAATIAAKLGVAYILDGSVRRSGDMVRVDAQLVEAKSGFERWTETYDRQVKDIFTVQADIADAVTKALKLKLLGSDADAVRAQVATAPAAHDAYLQGKALFDSAAGEAAMRAAIAKFDEALAADPAYAAPLTGKARALLALANQYAPDAEVKADYDAGLAAARKAATIDPGAAGPQLAMGELLLATRLDFAEAAPFFDRALQRDGGGADTLAVAGLFTCRRGDFDRGLSALRRATTLDPLNPRAFKALALGLTGARRYPEAIDTARRVLILNPRAAGAHALIGSALYLLRRYPEAQAAFALEPTDFQKQTGLAMTLHALGQDAVAKAALATLVAGGSLFTYQQAEVLAQLGDKVGAMAALRAAFVAGDAGLLLMKTDPLLDPVREEPGFLDLLTRLGLTR